MFALTQAAIVNVPVLSSIAAGDVLIIPASLPEVKITCPDFPALTVKRGE